MPRRKVGETKFDPPVPKEKWKPEQCDIPLCKNAEDFLAFCRRALGTSAAAPLVVDSEPLNGASIGNLAEAFAICYGLGRAGAIPVKAAPGTGASSNGEPEIGSIAARRAALLRESDVDA